MGIVGLGVLGSATAEALTRRGVNVLGLDRYTPPHERGSSHGETRMIREAYFEDPLYVPLVQRAFDLWRALEERADRNLLRQTGGLMIGRPESALVRGSRESAERHGLPYEELEAAEIRRRFPALQPDPDMVGILEPRAGFLAAERCVDSFLALAGEGGARLRTGTPVRSWQPDGSGVRIRTDEEEFLCGQLLLAAGAWIPALAPDPGLPLTVERAVQFWFEPDLRAAADLAPGRCPVYVWEPEPERIWYGFPAQPGGVKAGFHYGGETTDPDAVRRTVSESEVHAMQSVVRRFLPGAAAAYRRATVCLYTNTPDHHFLIDRHPVYNQVLLASACSGHGFKFGPVLGELLADYLVEGTRPAELEPFGLARFRKPPRC